jgi:hypothetical protein
MTAAFTARVRASLLSTAIMLSTSSPDLLPASHRGDQTDSQQRKRFCLSVRAQERPPDALVGLGVPIAEQDVQQITVDGVRGDRDRNARRKAYRTGAIDVRGRGGSIWLNVSRWLWSLTMAQNCCRSVVYPVFVSRPASASSPGRYAGARTSGVTPPAPVTDADMRLQVDAGRRRP